MDMTLSQKMETELQLLSQISIVVFTSSKKLLSVIEKFDFYNASLRGVAGMDGALSQFTYST